MKYKEGDKVWVDLSGEATDDDSKVLYIGPAVIVKIDVYDKQFEYYARFPIEVDEQMEHPISEHEILHRI